MSELRAVFDFSIEFTNGGQLAGAGYRLDVPREPSADEVGLRLVERLGPSSSSVRSPVRAYAVMR